MLPKFKKFMKNEAKPTRNRQVVTNERVSRLSGNSKMCQISAQIVLIHYVYSTMTIVIF